MDRKDEEKLRMSARCFTKMFRGEQLGSSSSFTAV